MVMRKRTFAAALVVATIAISAIPALADPMCTASCVSGSGAHWGGGQGHFLFTEDQGGLGSGGHGYFEVGGYTGWGEGYSASSGGTYSFGGGSPDGGCGGVQVDRIGLSRRNGSDPSC